MRLSGRYIFITGIMATGIMALAGCSGQQSDMKTELDKKLSEVSSISATTDAEEEKSADNSVMALEQETRLQ